MVGLPQTRKRLSTGFYGLSQTHKRGSMRNRWSVTDMRDGFRWLWSVWHRRARWVQVVVVGLAQTCEMGSGGCGWSVTEVQEGFHCVS